MPKATLMALLFLVQLVVAAVGVAGTEMQLDSSPPDAQMFNPTKGNLVAVSKGQVLWTSWTMIESTRGYRAPSFETQYYVEATCSTKPARMAFEHKGNVLREPVAVRDDGTVLLYNYPSRYTLAWFTPGWEPRFEPLQIEDQLCDALTLYPDGIIVRAPARRNEKLVPIWWVPIKGNSLDFDSKVSLTGDAKSKPGAHLTFIRYRGRIGWLDAQWSKGDDEAKRNQPVLHIFDIARRGVTNVVLSGSPVPPLVTITAFDGKLALASSALIDVETGQVRQLPSLKWEKPEGVVIYHTVGMLDGVIYVARAARDGYELRAVPVAEPEKGKVIHRWDAKEIPRDNPGTGLPKAFMKDLFFLDGDDVRAWNGQTWIRVPK